VINIRMYLTYLHLDGIKELISFNVLLIYMNNNQQLTVSEPAPLTVNQKYNKYHLPYIYIYIHSTS
jgi:hypothetical protein